MQPDYLSTVMPSVFVPEDGRWIQEQLNRLPPSLRQKIALRYAEVYQEAFDAEPVSFRQENRGRHEANTRLRKFVEAHGRAMQGYTIQPPMAVTR